MKVGVLNKCINLLKNYTRENVRTRHKKNPWKTKITGITQFNNQNSYYSKCKWYAKHV